MSLSFRQSDILNIAKLDGRVTVEDLAERFDVTVQTIRRDLSGRAFDDETTRRTMAQVYRQQGYLLDPHTAVGYLGLRAELEARKSEAPGGGAGIVLATAHPAKFSDVVREAVGIEPPLPPALEHCARLPEHIVDLPASREALRDLLLEA